MQQSTAVVLIAAFWAALFLIDSFLKSRHWYMNIMHRTGVSVHLVQVRWYTTYLNRVFVRIGTSRPRFLTAWFTAGVVFGCVAMVASQLLLAMVIVNKLSPQQVEQQILVPVMPGVNLPMSQIVYYLLTLFICGVFHEIGHAIAAIRETVRVNGFGVFVLGVYPGAFVDVATDQLQSASPLQQLRIYCAGVWHNFVIVVVALVILLTLPTLLSPFYVTNDAAIVTGIVENSAVSGPRGLSVGDHVTYVDNCRVTSVTDWLRCIQQSVDTEQHGYCLSLDTLLQQDIAKSVPRVDSDCCPNSTATHLCFTFYTKKRPSSPSHACLPARSTSDRAPCRVSTDCAVSLHDSTAQSAAQPLCVTPTLENSTRLIRVVHRSNSRPAMLFLGPPVDLFYSVYLSDYIPRWSFLPLNLHYVVDTLCRYLVSLSGALAILNVVPCYALDGQWILMALIELAVRPYVANVRIRAAIYRLSLLVGTTLLVTNIAIALWVLFVR